MNNNEKTVVIFRKDPDGTVFALFPELPGSPGLCMCYQHVGQHSHADFKGSMSDSVPASPEEYRALRKELESIGYSLIVRIAYKAKKRRN